MNWNWKSETGSFACSSRPSTRPCELDPCVTAIFLPFRSAMDDAVARAVDEFGRIDIAIANTGVSVAEGLTGLTEAMWNEVSGTNLTGVFNTVAAAAPVMAANGYGRIVTVSSLMGRSAAPSMAAYSASKWEVTGLSKSVALELAGNRRRSLPR